MRRRTDSENVTHHGLVEAPDPHLPKTILRMPVPFHIGSDAILLHEEVPLNARRESIDRLTQFRFQRIRPIKIFTQQNGTLNQKGSFHQIHRILGIAEILDLPRLTIHPMTKCPTWLECGFIQEA